MVKKSQKLVLIDDDPDVLTLLEERLVKDGYESKAFSDPRKGIKYIRKSVPDLVVCDIRMPGLNGFDLCQMIRSKDTTSHIPILLISAFHQAKEQAESLELSDLFFLDKPFKPKDLIAAIKQALETSVDLA